MYPETLCTQYIIKKIKKIFFYTFLSSCFFNTNLVIIPKIFEKLIYYKIISFFVLFDIKLLYYYCCRITII